MLRTHTCAELTKENKGTVVTLCGWVHRRRDHGGVIFFDLRDRYGLTQVTVRPSSANQESGIRNQEVGEVFHRAESIRSEFVVQVTGTVLERPENMVNPKLSTGSIEVEAIDLVILNTAKTPPFEIASEHESEQVVREEMRMKYRYIDLRSHRMKQNIEKRHELNLFIRNFLHEKKFVEVETPMLGKRTPEGARDYIVPARLHPGQFYALPQSPQQYKQLLMVSGLDRYFQIARCLRDEDTRGERQAEFTQLDIEMSFVERDDVLALIEELITNATKELFPERTIMQSPWPRLTYKECMDKYGIDKPDLRYGLEIHELSSYFSESPFEAFRAVVQNKGAVRAIVAPGATKFSRKELDELTEFVKAQGLPGLAYISLEEGGVLKSPILKFIGEPVAQEIIKTTGAQTGDIIFFAAGEVLRIRPVLAELRAELAKRLKLIDENVMGYGFVIDFPLFEEEMVDGHWAPSHHMFTSPAPEDVQYLQTDPGRVRSLQYDVIGNGHELGGGSIRIHDRAIQEKIFKAIGFSEEEKKEFVHMLEAFEFGAPPHGGIAVGIDRLLMELSGQQSIREVIAFPKTGDGRDLLMGAPSSVSDKQLKEVHIRTIDQ